MILKEEILKMADDSFLEGAKAAMESTIVALEALHKVKPDLTISDVIDIMKHFNLEEHIKTRI